MQNLKQIGQYAAEVWQ